MLKLQTLNCNGIARESIIDEKGIVGLSEIKTRPIQLFDDNGNLVKEEEQESTYKVFFTNGSEIRIDKATYDKLVARLKVDTL